MCDSGVDETVVHVMMECEEYDRGRMKMLRGVQREVEWDAEKVNRVVVRTEREWMVLLLGLSGEAIVRMMEAVKGLLERM